MKKPKGKRCQLRPDRLTCFVAGYAPGSSFDDLCFGDPAHHHAEEDNVRVYHFRPGQVFGLIWWRRQSDGSQHRVLAIVEALAADQHGHDLPGLHARATVHAILHQSGPAGQDGAVDLMLDQIQEMKSRGMNPATMTPAYWTELAHHILLCPILSHPACGKRMAC